MSTQTLPAGLTTGTCCIDPAHSAVGSSVRHAVVTRVRGSSSDVSGTVVLDEDAHLIAVEATVAMASVATRNGHLRTPGFVDVERQPTMRCASRSVAVTHGGVLVTGDLALHGMTHEVVLEVEAGGVATDPFGNARAGSSAETQVSRSDDGLTYDAALEGGVLVSDTARISSAPLRVAVTPSSKETPAPKAHLPREGRSAGGSTSSASSAAVRAWRRAVRPRGGAAGR